MKTELGGDRLGSGNKQEISLRNYERSTHDLGYIWRSSMSSGTLVPFMSEVALPGDSFDIDLDCDVKTLPTVGPLFGSYKVQLDVFECPVRLYQGKLHMNMLNIGMDMSEVLLPQMEFHGKYYPDNLDDNAQINSSSIYSYLNMRGFGRTASGAEGSIKRYFNAIPYLGYWDIYKNYYANKQEERGYVIHAEDLSNKFQIKSAVQTVDGVSSSSSLDIFEYAGDDMNTEAQGTGAELPSVSLVVNVKWENTGEPYGEPDPNSVIYTVNTTDYTLAEQFTVVNVVEVTSGEYNIVCTGYYGIRQDGPYGVKGQADSAGDDVIVNNTEPEGMGQPQLTEFPLNNIDDMRMDILEAVRDTTAFQVLNTSQAPYGLGLSFAGSDWGQGYAKSSQEGLGIKTYQSDLFNNWISTEWIDGTNGVNEVTAVSTAGNEFTIDALNLANKVYNMLNRIAISGGSYDDWLDAVYTHERSKSCESPVYHGSLIKELAFEEVVSNADTNVSGDNEQPLGTLAGRGRLTNKNKGGKIKIKVSEPSYIIGIASLTPRIDYSQGNKWDVNLKNMNDFHKPALDEIGFQDLTTDQLAWFDSVVDASGNVTYSSVGKQPAWINYMTNVNQTRGSFAEVVGENNPGASMFMTLNRRYEQGTNGIEDLTTYVDPSKYNEIFAQTALDSQNFWVQISNRITARRKMSAKVIPNL
jgi:hypothetical protein